MVSSGDGPVGASKLTEEVGAIEGTFNNSVLVFCSWLRRLTLSISSSCIRGPRAEKKNCRRASISFFQMLSIMGSLPTMVKDMTGVDIKQKITASC